MSEKLSAEKVTEIIKHCLYRKEELPQDGSLPDGAVLVEGIIKNYGFNPQRLAEKKNEIRLMINELPSEFMKSGGGGTSFLNACVDKHGNHWAEHLTMEALFVLGIAIKEAGYCLPRDMWSALPGGMPYLFVDDGAAKAEQVRS